MVGESLSLYRQFFRHFVSIALAVFVITSLVSALATVPDSDTTSALIAVVGLVIGIVGFVVVQGALTIAVDDVRDGRIDLSFDELFSRSRSRAVQLFLLGLVLAVGLGVVAVIIAIGFAATGVLWLGIVLDIVLILVVITRWAVAVPVCVLEGHGPIESLERSWSLTKGHSGRVFLIILVTGLLGGIASRILTAMLSALLTGFVDVWLTSTLANGILTPFLSIAWTLMYFHLRPLPAKYEAPAIPSGAAYRDE